MRLESVIKCTDSIYLHGNDTSGSEVSFGEKEFD